jgi:hypothetical protein
MVLTLGFGVFPGVLLELFQAPVSGILAELGTGPSIGLR